MVINLRIFRSFRLPSLIKIITEGLIGQKLFVEFDGGGAAGPDIEGFGNGTKSIFRIPGPEYHRVRSWLDGVGLVFFVGVEVMDPDQFTVSFLIQGPPSRIEGKKSYDTGARNLESGGMALADHYVIQHDLGDGGNLYIITSYQIFTQFINFLEMQGLRFAMLAYNELHITVMCTTLTHSFQVALGRICSDDGMLPGSDRNIVYNDGRDGMDLYPVGDQGIKI